MRPWGTIRLDAAVCEMFRITERATAQIKLSREKLGEDALRLRISARYSPKHGIDYKVGFDDVYETDIKLEVDGIEIVYDRDTEKMIEGMVVDYREFDGRMQIVFENPNDVIPEDGKSDEISEP